MFLFISEVNVYANDELLIFAMLGVNFLFPKFSKIQFFIKRIEIVCQSLSQTASASNSTAQQEGTRERASERHSRDVSSV